ncbi:MAG: ChbG/HpnK family deacetylase [Oscillospiraceae bacterium]|jgi:hypothetical protein|nr:ChbG/HpnK family deacetylase [Oscillospiraceae bacterium]
MKDIRFITRADDGGSSRSANIAMQRIAENGIIKNFSIMAPGAFCEDLYGRMGARTDVCFGLHHTLNAEWDRVKWGPVSGIPADSPLTDAHGFFRADPRDFAGTKPDPALIVKEASAQLDKLTRIGFDIKYMDSHMFPECFIPGMDEALQEFMQAKGLIDHMYFYNLPPGFLEVARGEGSVIQTLLHLPEGQFFTVAHPAQASAEMLLTGNAAVSGEKVCRGRNLEAKLYASRITKALLQRLGITALRYDEAVPGERARVSDLLVFFKE